MSWMCWDQTVMSCARPAWRSAAPCGAGSVYRTTARLLPLSPPSALCQRCSVLGVGVQIVCNKYLLTIVVLREMHALCEISEVTGEVPDPG